MGLTVAELLIPLISGIIGWGTNVQAVKMMFHPVNPIGWPPWFGWVGIVPSNAERLAKVGLSLIMRDLLKIHELFEGRKAEDFLAPSESRMIAMTKQIVDEQASRRFPAMWQMLPESAKAMAHETAVTEVKGMSVRVVERVISRMPELLDTEAVVLNAVRSDKTLMNQMFLQVGKKEFSFIEWSGLWFGLLFGFVQFAAWLIYPAWWTLPAFGFVVGYVTNWLALVLIFDPKKPKNILGFTVQGLFHKRQAEVAHEFGIMISSRVFNNENIFRQLSRSESRLKILDMVEEEADAALAKWQNHPMAMGIVTPELVAEMRAEIRVAVEVELFAENGVIASVTAQSDEIRRLLQERMKAMDPEAFENVLRPAFKQDEWKLIVVGAVLGLIVGFLQVWFTVSDQVVP
ncbi:MAG: hypothetical protein IV100_05960 [Myxococcales bacterium]|nr:hypothetical protein [Myxococcales bacterium]